MNPWMLQASPAASAGEKEPPFCSASGVVGRPARKRVARSLPWSERVAPVSASRAASQSGVLIRWALFCSQVVAWFLLASKLLAVPQQAVRRCHRSCVYAPQQHLALVKSGSLSCLARCASKQLLFKVLRDPSWNRLALSVCKSAREFAWKFVRGLCLTTFLKGVHVFPFALRVW